VPFKNRKLAKRVAKKPCEWCGWTAGRRHAAHIIDEGKERDWNAISLCPNCSTVFDEVVRPALYRALKEWGATNLPESWSRDNKLSGPPGLASDGGNG
jgi:ssDNA-binding Zn-finger/Zn-ribbon topoisomerase 1